MPPSASPGWRRSPACGQWAVELIVRIARAVARRRCRRRDRGAGVADADQVAGLIVDIGHRPLRRRRLGRKPVERVVAEGEGGAGARLPREHVVVGAVTVVFGAAVRIGRRRETIETVGRKTRGIAVGVSEAADQPVRRIALLQQRVRLDGRIENAGAPTHGVIAVHREPSEWVSDGHKPIIGVIAIGGP